MIGREATVEVFPYSNVERVVIGWGDRLEVDR